MKARMPRISPIFIIGGVVVLALLIGVAQLSMAGDGPETTTHSAIVSKDAVETSTCTTGPTGNCAVQYEPYAGNDPQRDCGAASCKVRVELRW